MLNTHVFAFYTPDVTKIINRKVQADSFEITDPLLIHRICTVLRLEISDKIELFNDTHYINCIIAQINKKNILVEIESITNNIIQHPAIYWILPMLKRDAFEQSIYALAEIGVQEIQLTYTQKTKHGAIDQKDLDRAQKIIIAAAEQSKNFAMPKMQPILPFEQLIYKISQIQAQKVFFDVLGEPIHKLIKNINNAPIIAMCGPEGDLTDAEKQMLLQANFNFYRLTKTILRSQQAISIGAGILRSI